MASDKAIIAEAAQRYGIEPKVLWGLYGTETSFGKDLSTSSAGAVGPFQFEPATAKSMGINPYNFRAAAFGAARYLAQYKSRGLGGMLSAYNAGPAGGYQKGYVESTLRNAKSFGTAPGAPIRGGAPGTTEQPTPGRTTTIPGLPGYTEPTFDQAGYEKAKTAAVLGKLFTGAERKENPLFATGLLSAKEPVKSKFEGSRTVPGLPSSTITEPGGVPVANAGRAPRGGTKLGGFLGRSAPLEIKRQDMGRDIQTRPGEALLAPGDGTVVAVKSDPSGFGPDYPVIKFTSGPMAGQSWYLGHTDSTLRAGQSFKAGDPIARTSRTGHNAPPGWAEIGFASALGTGNMQAGRGTGRYLGIKE